MQMNCEKNYYDIVIIGAGLVGCITALLLSKNKNLNVLILDKKIPNTSNLNFEDKDQYHPRVVALNIASQKILANLGVWGLLPDSRLGWMSKISVSESQGPQKIEFDSFAAGHDTLAYVVENELLLKKLHEKLTYKNNINIKESEIDEIKSSDKYTEVSINKNGKITTKLVIAADGANSFVRNYFGLETSIDDYQHTALVANILTDKSHENTAKQKFLKTGPVALLPLGEKHNISIVWSTDKESAQKLIDCSKEEFCLELNKQFNFKIGEKIELNSNRFTFPLIERHAKSYFHNRVVLIGDAAHTIHPLAGQGLNLGIQDAKILSEEILKAQDKYADFGDENVLKRYQSKRRGHNQILIYAMRFFKNFYSSQSLPVSVLRNLGVGVFNQSNFIKDKIIKLAIGE